MADARHDSHYGERKHFNCPRDESLVSIHKESGNEREERDFKAPFIHKRQESRHHRTRKFVRIHESRPTQDTKQRRRDGCAKENRRAQPHSQQQHPKLSNESGEHLFRERLKTNHRRIELWLLELARVCDTQKP